MTSTARTSSPRPNPPRGWRVHRIPGKRATPTDNGVLVPLWLVHDGLHKADADIHLSPDEAEQLHAELCYVLGDGEDPACRGNNTARAGLRWP